LGKQTSSLFAYLRKAEDPSNHVLVVLNFSDQKIGDYHLGPFDGQQYQIIFNSDSEHYGGDNGGGHFGEGSEQYIWMNKYSALMLKPEHLV